MIGIDGPRPAVLVLAGGAGWESALLRALEQARIVVLRRCVDESDLMAAGSTGLARVAVLAAEHHGVDAEVVGHLLRHGVRCVAVGNGPEQVPDEAGRLLRLGVDEIVAPGPDAVVAAVLRVAAATDPTEAGLPVEVTPEPLERRRVVAVWGPTGAPGRSTLAIALAAEVAAAGCRVVLVDADPYGGTVAQRLGVLDEASGLLGVARAANNGLLDDAALLAACRRVDGIEVLTGLPRAERRVEVRPGVLDAVLDQAARLAPVLVDCGFGLEDDPSSRDRMSLEALAAADEIVAVGAADPVGMTRLLRGLVDLGEAGLDAPVRVVLNQMRPGLGWRTEDLVGLVAGHISVHVSGHTSGQLPGDRIHVVPEDRGTLDRALVAGRAHAELGDSPFRRAVGPIARAVLPDCFPAAPFRPRVRGRRSARA
jgi:MinD-like ATPase involved in chromosome partitioning or flagellar assembly